MLFVYARETLGEFLLKCLAKIILPNLFANSLGNVSSPMVIPQDLSHVTEVKLTTATL